MNRFLGSDGRGGIVVRVALSDGRKDSAVQHRVGGRRRDRAGRRLPGVGGRGTGAGRLRGRPGQEDRRPEAAAVAFGSRKKEQCRRRRRRRRRPARSVFRGTPADPATVFRRWRTGSGAPVAVRRVRGRHGGRHRRRRGPGAIRARTVARGRRRLDHQLPAAVVPAASRSARPTAVAVPTPAVRRIAQHLLAPGRVATTVGPGRAAFVGRVREAPVQGRCTAQRRSVGRHTERYYSVLSTIKYYYLLRSV